MGRDKSSPAREGDHPEVVEGHPPRPLKLSASAFPASTSPPLGGPLPVPGGISSPLAAQILDRVEQSALGRGAIDAGVAGQFWLPQFRAALGQRFAERWRIDQTAVPFGIIIQEFRCHDRTSFLRRCPLILS